MSQSRPTKHETDVYSGHYVLHGEQSNAFREAFPNSKAKAETIHVMASKFHSIDKVRTRIEELKEQVRLIAEKDFKIDAAWVLSASVDLYNKCMEAEPLKNSEGQETGYAKFQPAGAGKALELIGKHVDVQAYKEKSEVEIKGSLKVSTTLKSRLTGGSRR